ncbi:MAG: biotin/lipoyl-containing protein [Thermodesulfobacteriota bacterium]|nr:biotin/lipoyl-containing protein [Thermodesulfobacteriota bacterium]
MKSNEVKLTYDLTYKDVVDILKIIDDSACQELHLEMGDLKLDVIKGRQSGSETMSGPIEASQGSANPQAASLGAPEKKIAKATSEARPKPKETVESSSALGGEAAIQDFSGIVISSPLTGTFYQSSAPGAKPFVEVGSVVKTGDQVAIVEVMKLMNSIKAPQEGIIREILVENETMVKMGQILMTMDPLPTKSSKKKSSKKNKPRK